MPIGCRLGLAAAKLCGGASNDCQGAMEGGGQHIREGGTGARSRGLAWVGGPSGGQFMTTL